MTGAEGEIDKQGSSLRRVLTKSFGMKGDV